MRILYANLTDQTIPPPPSVIRADTYISIPLATHIHKRGHSVAFVVPKDSRSPVPSIYTTHRAFIPTLTTEQLTHIKNERTKIELWNPFLVDILLSVLDELNRNTYDVFHLHSNIPTIELPFLSKIKIPTIVTLHSTIRSKVEENAVINEMKPPENVFFVAISNSQRNEFTSLPFVATIHNGIDTTIFSESANNNSENILYAGRIKKTKGIKDAIITSMKIKKSLIVAGSKSLITNHDIQFYENEIRPLLAANTITFLGHQERSKMPYIYQHAKAMIAPLSWEEPFGLTMIESMACGTPVIAYARGSVPEVIKDGETGFIVNSSEEDKRGDWIIKKTGIEGLCEAVERMYALPEEEYKQMRKNCRAHVEKYFTVERMVDQYETLYKEIIEKNKNL